MKILEITCSSKDKEDVGMLLTKKEREIIFEAVKEYSNKYKRKTAAKKFYNYIYKHMPV